MNHGSRGGTKKQCFINRLQRICLSSLNRAGQGGCGVAPRSQAAANPAGREGWDGAGSWPSDPFRCIFLVSTEQTVAFHAQKCLLVSLSAPSPPVLASVRREALVRARESPGDLQRWLLCLMVLNLIMQPFTEKCAWRVLLD